MCDGDLALGSLLCCWGWLVLLKFELSPPHNPPTNSRPPNTQSLNAHSLASTSRVPATTPMRAWSTRTLPTSPATMRPASTTRTPPTHPVECPPHPPLQPPPWHWASPWALWLSPRWRLRWRRGCLVLLLWRCCSTLGAHHPGLLRILLQVRLVGLVVSLVQDC